jgi:hypothetical protein
LLKGRPFSQLHPISPGGILADEYKALTAINLPFVGKTFQPGEMVSRADFDDNAEHELAQSADEEIAALISAGALSEDADAPLHPDHIPVDLGTLNVSSVVQEARTLVAQMEADGKEIPEELKKFAAMDVRAVSADDAATSNEKGA